MNDYYIIMHKQDFYIHVKAPNRVSAINKAEEVYGLDSKLVILREKPLEHKLFPPILTTDKTGIPHAHIMPDGKVIS